MHRSSSAEAEEALEPRVEQSSGRRHTRSPAARRGLRDPLSESRASRGTTGACGTWSHRGRRPGPSVSLICSSSPIEKLGLMDLACRGVLLRSCPLLDRCSSFQLVAAPSSRGQNRRPMPTKTQARSFEVLDTVAACPRAPWHVGLAPHAPKAFGLLVRPKPTSVRDRARSRARANTRTDERARLRGSPPRWRIKPPRHPTPLPLSPPSEEKREPPLPPQAARPGVWQLAACFSQLTSCSFTEWQTGVANSDVDLPTAYDGQLDDPHGPIKAPELMLPMLLSMRVRAPASFARHCRFDVCQVDSYEAPSSPPRGVRPHRAPPCPRALKTCSTCASITTASWASSCRAQ